MSELLPPSASRLERHAATASASATELPVLLRALWNPEDCAAELLPWLAWAWSVDSWDDGWSDRQKRSTIAEALEVQQVKGTIGSVRRALAAIGIPSRVQEWHRQTPAGEPYTFRLLLDVDQDPMGQRGIFKILDVVEATKSLRSHLETVIQQITTRTDVHIGAAANTGHETSLLYEGLQYGDGEYALDLMTDSAYHGEASTVEAVDRLHLTLHSATYIDLLLDARHYGQARTIAAIDQLNALTHTLNLTPDW